MDPELQSKIDEAKAAGYSDEEIQQYLANKSQPVPEQKPMDRTESQIGTAQGIGLEAVKTGAELYGAKKLLEAAGNAFRGPQGGPVAPSQPQATIGNAAWDQALKKPVATPPTSSVDAATKIVRSLALSKLLPAAQVGMGLFYTSPEEVATLKAAEQRRKQGLQ